MPDVVQASTPLAEQLRQRAREVEAAQSLTTADRLRYRAEQLELKAKGREWEPYNSVLDPAYTIARTAQEIDIAAKTLDDDLFSEANTDVSKLKRMNQIRRKAGMGELNDLPSQLKAAGSTASMKQKFYQAMGAAHDQTSVGLAKVWMEGREIEHPPPGIGWSILTQATGLLADPATYAFGGVGGVVGREVGKQAIKKGGSIAASKVLQRGTALGTTLTGLTAARDIPGQKARIRVPEVISVENEDGTMSSEKTIGVSVDELNDGRETLIPTIVEGQRLSKEEAIRYAIQSGLKYPDFDSVKKAKEYAAWRTEQGGAEALGFLGQRPDIDFGQTLAHSQRAGLTGFAAGGVGVAPGALGLGAEIGAFEVVGSALEGELPTWEGLAESAGVILTLRATHAIPRGIGKALRKQLVKEELTAEEQAVLNQVPEKVQARIVADARQKVMDAAVEAKAKLLSKDGLLTQKGADEFTRSYGMQARAVAKAEKPSRQAVRDPVANVLPEVSLTKSADRAKFQRLVQNSLDRGIGEELPPTPAFRRENMIAGRLQNQYRMEIRPVPDSEGKIRYLKPNEQPVSNRALQEATKEVDARLGQETTTIEQGRQELVQQELPPAPAPPPEPTQATLPPGTRPAYKQARAAEERATNVTQEEPPDYTVRAMRKYAEARAEEEAAIMTQPGIVPESAAKFAKTQEAVVKASQEAATPDTPPELVPIVPVESTVNARARGLNPAKKLVSALATGGLPTDAFKANVEKEAFINAIIRQAHFGVDDYNRAIHRVYGVLGRVPAEDIQKINDVATRRAPYDTLPEELRGPVMKMRNDTDALSQAMIDSGFVQGKMALTFTEKLGAYWHRSYRIFRTPATDRQINKYIRKLPPQVVNKATALLRSELEEIYGRPLTANEMDAQLRSFLYTSAEQGSPIAMLASKGMHRDLSFLKQLNEKIPAEIRAVWGEDTDPRIQYVNSVIGLGNLLGSAKALRQMREAGLGKWLFERPTGEAIAPIDKEGTIKALYPLTEGKPLFTTDWHLRAMNRAFGPKGPAPWLLRSYYKVNAGVKWGKTAGNVPMGMIRNFFGNPTFAFANGHFKFWRPISTAKKVGQAIRAVRTDIADVGLRDTPQFFDFLKLSNREQKDFVTEMIQRRIMHDASQSGELREMMRDASKYPTPGAYIESVMARAALWPFKKATQFFRGADDLWRVFNYLSELEDLRSVYPEKPLEWVKNRAAYKTLKTNPTYSTNPEIAKQMRKAIFVGDFVNWPVAVVRATIGVPSLIAEEMQIPQERIFAARRAFHFMALAGGVAGMGAATRWMHGVTPEKEEASRKLGPEWMENSPLIHQGSPGRLQLDVIDSNYSVPQSFMVAPVIAALRGEDWQEATKDGLREAFRPFLNETILAGVVRDIAANQRISQQSKASVYNMEDPSWPFQIVAYAFDKLKPGTFRAVEKVYKGITNQPMRSGKVPDLQRELLAHLTGQRIQRIDAPRDLGYKARSLAKRRSDAKRIFYAMAYRTVPADAAEVADAYEKAVAADADLFKEMQEIVQATKVFGMTDSEIETVLSEERVAIPKREIKRLLGGTHDSEKLVRDAVFSLTDKEYDERLLGILKALGVSEAEAERLLVDEIRERGYKTITPRLVKLRRRFPE